MMAGKEAGRPLVLWFRQDLRVGDNRALTAALKTGRPVVPVYVLDDQTPGAWKMGGASRWWLHHSLASLSRGLDELGARLILRRGVAGESLVDLVEECAGAGVYFTRAYEPSWAKAEQELREAMEKQGREVQRFAGSMLFEPEAIRTKSGDPYRVYTPYWRACNEAGPPKAPRGRPDSWTSMPGRIQSDDLDDWELLPTEPDWAEGLREAWTPGEMGAQENLDRFLAEALADYDEGRDRPDRRGTSRLSPHLHFGEISPHQCWHAAVARLKRVRAGDQFLKELVWREFSTQLLAHWPKLPTESFRPEFEDFPWKRSKKKLRAWQRGRTGYPIVDAGMRELWETGWMHNRVRMIVASFLVKDLLIHWREGENWFWDTLVDADLANNAAGWQWVAGSGADAAPYFRVFNPVSQGKKFDPQGDYVRRFVPELENMPKKHIHAPWEAPDEVLEEAGVELGRNYPAPIVDHARARRDALAAYETIKKKG